MPAQQGKGGTGFELYVAAALKTDIHHCNGRPLDLRDFTFNVNPKTYSAEGTGTGYSVTVDIIATMPDFDYEYIIECKSSIYVDEILDLKDSQFLKAMLEFLAIEHLYSKLGWKTYYILATGFPVARRLIALSEQRDLKQLTDLSKRLVAFGINLHGENINKKTLSPECIAQVLKKTTYLQLYDQYIRSKMNTDQAFAESYKIFSIQLKPLRTQQDSEKNPLEASQFEIITFMCKSTTHEACSDVAIGKIVCHCGPIDKILNYIDFFRKKSDCFPKNFYS